MRILHVINSLAAGGAEKLVSELSTAQAKSQEVGLFTLVSNNDLFQDELSNKIKLHLNYGNGFFTLSNLWKLYKVIGEYDVIHAHLFPSFYMVAIISFFHPKKKYVLTEHSTVNKRRRSGFNWIEKVIYSRFSNIICISEGVREALTNWIGKTSKVFIINNFVDIQAIKEVTQNPPLPCDLSKQRLLIMVGSFSEKKDQKTIVRALKLLDDNYSLLLVGDGPKRAAIEREVAELNLIHRVHFLGIRKDVIALMKISDYGILSSHAEGFGIVALEYMVSGLVALGSNVDGLNEVIPVKENLFQPEDHTQLSDRILAIENNPSLQLEIKEVQAAHITNFDISMSLKAHFQLYQSNNLKEM